MHDYQREFIEFAIRNEVLRFGQFTLKSGRMSPYFFNSMRSRLAFDVLFGPAYKGIPLAVATAVALADHHGRDVPYAFNRKEAKDHGEGGIIVGAALQGRVLIIDDVISAGTSVSESIRLIKGVGAEPAGVVVALDRQERSHGELSAIQEVEQRHGIPVLSIITLDQITACMTEMEGTEEALTQIRVYRDQYGV